MLKFMKKDMMLLAAGVSPILMGLAIRLGIPAIEQILIKFTGLSHVLSPYYGLLDIFYSAITPAMFCFVAAMVMLEEHDDHIDNYLFITGLGKRGYFISRIVIPAASAFVVTLVLLPLFRLSSLSFMVFIFLALSGALQGIIIALMVVKLSSNKLEGMAITKLSSLIMLGAMAPYFMPSPQCYLLSFMPSFWTGMVLWEKNYFFMLPSLAIAGIWIFVLGRLR